MTQWRRWNRKVKEKRRNNRWDLHHKAVMPLQSMCLSSHLATMCYISCTSTHQAGDRNAGWLQILVLEKPGVAGNMMIPAAFPKHLAWFVVGNTLNAVWETDLYTWKQFIKCMLAICVKLVSDLLRQQVITQSGTAPKSHFVKESSKDAVQ